MADMAPSDNLSLNWPVEDMTPEEYLEAHPDGAHALTAKVITGKACIDVQLIDGGAEEIQPPQVAHKERLAIVGFAPSTRGAAPWGNEDFEVWGLNELHQSSHAPDCPGPWSRWFEIHQVEDLVGSHRDKDHFRWLQEQQGMPIYMQKHNPEIPASVSYPLELICRTFPHGDYLTNSISQMIALALLESVEWHPDYGFVPVEGGFREIHLYGVDMATDTEYMEQRPSVEYWCGICESAGIKLFIPSKSDILKAGGIYGYDNLNDLRKKMKDRMVELDQTVNHHNANELAHRDAKNQAIGAKDNCMFTIRNYGVIDDAGRGRRGSTNAD